MKHVGHESRKELGGEQEDQQEGCRAIGEGNGGGLSQSSFAVVKYPYKSHLWKWGFFRLKVPGYSLSFQGTQDGRNLKQLGTTIVKSKERMSTCI